jgi:hypothetical protein
MFCISFSIFYLYFFICIFILIFRLRVEGVRGGYSTNKHGRIVVIILRNIKDFTIFLVKGGNMGAEST